MLLTKHALCAHALPLMSVLTTSPNVIGALVKKDIFGMHARTCACTNTGETCLPWKGSLTLHVEGTALGEGQQQEVGVGCVLSCLGQCPHWAQRRRCFPRQLCLQVPARRPGSPLQTELCGSGIAGDTEGNRLNSGGEDFGLD